MKRTSKQLLISLSLTSKLLSTTKLSTPIKHFPLIRPLSTITTQTENKDPKVLPKPNRKDSLILEQFRLRQRKGSLKTFPETKPTTTCSSTGVEKARRGTEAGLENVKGAPTNVVSSFQELGLREEMIWAAEEMDIWVPSEIQCVGIPAVLDGKSVVLSSKSGSGRTLAYLLPLLQLLRQDESVSMKPKHPRAIVLCTTEELSDEGFRVAQFISDHARLKSSLKNGDDQSKGPQDLSNTAIGMLVGTPGEVLEHIEEGNLVCDDLKYLVLDDADTMLNHGFGPEIQKIISPMKDCIGFQIVLVTSSVTEMLGKQLSPVVEHVERNHAGKVTAMLLEMDQKEVFDLLESLDVLKKKVDEAMDSLRIDVSGS